MSTVSLSKEDIQVHYKDIYLKADKHVERLLVIMFLFGIFIAFFYDTWLVAVGVGSLNLLAYFVTKKLLPGSNVYQYILSVVTTIFAAQYIYQMHGMAEMHFWVFICSTVLIIYQNWRLQVPMILIVYIHHGTFAYLQYLGVKEVYFTQLEYMDITTFLFHAVLATCVCLVAALWGYNIRQRTLRDALNFKTLSLLKEELQDKNEELLASEEELTASGEALRKNNENLHTLVEQKTQALLLQNTKLMQHAFLNAHKVRSPLARILGLVNLLDYEMKDAYGKDVLQRLNEAAIELDAVLGEVKANLEEAEYKFVENENKFESLVLKKQTP